MSVKILFPLQIKPASKSQLKIVSRFFLHPRLGTKGLRWLWLIQAMKLQHRNNGQISDIFMTQIFKINKILTMNNDFLQPQNIVKKCLWHEKWIIVIVVGVANTGVLKTQLWRSPEQSVALWWSRSHIRGRDSVCIPSIASLTELLTSPRDLVTDRSEASYSQVWVFRHV